MWVALKCKYLLKVIYRSMLPSPGYSPHVTNIGPRDWNCHLARNKWCFCIRLISQSKLPSGSVQVTKYAVQVTINVYIYIYIYIVQ